MLRLVVSSCDWILGMLKNAFVEVWFVKVWWTLLDSVGMFLVGVKMVRMFCSVIANRVMIFLIWNVDGLVMVKSVLGFECS